MPNLERSAPAKRQPLSERNRVLIWIFTVLAIFLIANAINNSRFAQNDVVYAKAPTETVLAPRITATPQLSATINQPTPTKTPLPAEYLQNYDDTNGVVVGTVLLVVIILLGTLSGMRVRRSQG